MIANKQKHDPRGRLIGVLFFMQKNEGSRRDTLLTAHFERAIIITVRHDEPLTSQSATAGGYDNTFAVALLLAWLD